MTSLPARAAWLISLPILAPQLLAGPLVEFETTVVKVEATPEQTEVPLVYKFTVKGDAIFRIADLEIGCGCLKATADKLQYQPGEKGEIKATMAISAFAGEVSKSINVISNDSVRPQIPLTAAVKVPKLIVLEPTTVSWTVGEPLTPKTLRLKVDHTKPINVVKITSNRPNVTHTLVAVKPGYEYEITLTPQSTTDPMLGMLTIETDSPIPRYKQLSTFFNVTRRMSAANTLKPIPLEPPAPTK